MKGFANLFRFLALAAVTCGLTTSVGCQVELGGQTLPSPWYLDDDVQYYAPGQPFKLDKEAAAIRAAAAETEVSALQQP